MPAPKTPNTARATEVAAAKARRRGQETMAAKLRAAGWTVTPPPDDRPPHPAQLIPEPKGYMCPACQHGTGVHREHGCDVVGCDCPAPYGRIMPGDTDPTED